ncbi:hypothetical protein [Hymenobacter swuensis]|uniref:hypothetical protein n=1 Tax=Hymenobacter swuensis TaxID=1446467 RepID=UPI0012DCCE8D|nr:hypothetical protein [Hymenobacter swuensis]
MISSLEYDEWVLNWKKQEYATILPHEWSRLFKHDGKVLTGVTFEFAVLSYLLSTPGVATVKMRFGLRKWHTPESLEEHQEFHLILFGVDNANEIVTPYFTSYAFTYHYRQGQLGEGGNLPRALMRQWEEEWYQQAKAEAVDHAMFTVRYGLLQGYNYPLGEIMSALGAFNGAANVQIRFGLHRYYDSDYVSDLEPATRYAFGLILYASRAVEPGAAVREDAALAATGGQPAAPDGAIEDSGYYDLTAPCPRTC